MSFPLSAAPGLDRTARLLPWIALPPLACGALLAVALLLILRANGAIFYTLDDPYIHLALSEELARGHYGLHPGEFAAPSSSILWPFLLAPFASQPWHHLVPLLINLSATLATVALLFHILHEGTRRQAPGLSALLALLIAWCGGILPLAFTGMEHSLHVLTTAATMLGLALLIEQGRMPAWLPALLMLAPLVRYEAAALSLTGLILVWKIGHGRTAAIAALAGAAMLAAFSLFLVSHGLAPLPGSVLAKLHEGLDGGGGLFEAAIRSVNLKLAQSEGRNLLLPLVALVLAAALLRQGIWLAAAVGGAVLLHFAFGLLTERYVVYLRVLLLLSVAYVLAPQLVAIWRGRGAAIAGLLILIAAAPLSFEPGRALARVPGSVRDVRLLQGEAHRFLVEYWRRPAAVNDLGQAAYRNPNYVLDLWGLASEEARRARRGGGQGWAEPLLETRGVPLALIFESWLRPAMPPDWVRLGSMEIDRAIVTHMREELAFYADPNAAGELACLLAGFAETLPEGVRFRFAPDAPQGAAACHAIIDPRYSAP
jgi:hypothetical protein